MYNSTIKSEEIFFGFVHGDGTRSSLVKRQPTHPELEKLWATHPELFGCNCMCGEKAYVYSHIVEPSESEPGRVGKSYVRIICPHCGSRTDLGANYMVSQLRIRAINTLEEKEL